MGVDVGLGQFRFIVGKLLFRDQLCKFVIRVWLVVVHAPHATNGLYTDAAREVPGACSRCVVVDKMLTTFKMRFDEATHRPDTCAELQKVLAPTGTNEPVTYGLTIGKSRMDLTVPAFACAATCLEQIRIDREPDDCRRIVAIDDQ